jgi:hypothetical protein
MSQTPDPSDDLRELGRAIAAAQDARISGAPVPPFSSARPAGKRRPWLTLIIGIQIGALLSFGIAAWWRIVWSVPGTVVVTVTGATEANVRVDDEPPVHAAPSVTLERVRSGRHVVVVEAPGFVAFSTTFVLDPKSQPLFALKAQLHRLDGELVVTSTPPDADLYVDGARVDRRTPTRLLLEGDLYHRVEVRGFGYRSVERSVRVPAGGSAALDVTLERLPDPAQLPPANR